MIPLRVRDLLSHMDGTERRALKALLPKLAPPAVDTYPYPNALMSLLPKDERYSLLGCIAEEVLRSEPTIESFLAAIQKWYPPFDKAMEDKLLKSKTSAAFLDHLTATKEAWDKVAKGPLTFDTEVAFGMVQGHPDAQTPTQVFEVKLTGQLEKNWLDFLFQVFAYGALSPATQDLYLVLPLQRTVFHHDIRTWAHRVAYRDFLHTLSVKRQDASALKSPIPGFMLQATYGIGTHIGKGKLIDTLKGLSSPAFSGGGACLAGSFASSEGLKDVTYPIQLFLGSTLSSKISIKDEDVAAGADALKAFKHSAYVHSPYIINLSMAPGSKDDYGVTLLVKNLDYAKRMGFRGVVVHVGKSVDRPVDEALENMRLNLITAAESATPLCPILLETPAGQGTELLTEYDDFVNFVADFKDERIRMCVDTCHVFASGFCPYEYVKGVVEDHLDLLKLVHFNDSHGACTSCVDRHAFIGTGLIGIETLTKVAQMCAGKVDMVIE
jgi:endonuclease IV